MDNVLRKIAFFVGFGLWLLSVYWSSDGFNFNIAGDSGYINFAIFISYFLAIAVGVVQFIFSSDYIDLNPSLIVLGLLAYIYSIYTNYQGILHFQGMAQNPTTACVLAVIIDAVPEPIIAWGLYEFRKGDLISNLIKTIIGAPGKLQQNNLSRRSGDTNKSGASNKVPPFRPLSPEIKKKIYGNQYFNDNLHGVNPKSRQRFE